MEQLLLLSAKINLSATEVDTFNALAERIVDWPAFVQILSRAGIAPLFYKKTALLRNTQLLPASEQTVLQQYYYKTLARSMQLQMAFGEIVKQFAANNIQLIALKGIYLSEHLYADLGTRQMSDIDILVHEEQGKQALAVLEGMGYTCNPDPLTDHDELETVHYAPMVRQGVSVEVHIKLHRLNEGYNMSNAQLWQHAQLLNTATGQHHVMDKYDLLNHICVHFHKHFVQGGVSFSGVSDMINIANEMFDSVQDWSVFVARCEAYGTSKYVFRYLLLLRDYIHMPPNILQSMQHCADAHTATLFVKYMHGYRGFTSGVPKHKSNLQYLHGFWPKAKYFVRIIFPPLSFMQGKYKTKNKWKLLLCYPHRWWLGVKGLAPQPPKGLAPQPPKGGVRDLKI